MSDPVLTREQIEKYIEQGERKKQYNREYYHTKIKPKRETEQQELVRLRQECANLQVHLQTVQQVIYQQIHNDFQGELNSLTEANQELKDENDKLTRKASLLTRDIKVLQAELERSRQQLYEVMLEKADEILPKVILNPKPLD